MNATDSVFDNDSIFNDLCLTLGSVGFTREAEGNKASFSRQTRNGYYLRIQLNDNGVDAIHIAYRLDGNGRRTDATLDDVKISDLLRIHNAEAEAIFSGA